MSHESFDRFRQRNNYFELIKNRGLPDNSEIFILLTKETWVTHPNISEMIRQAAVCSSRPATATLIQIETDAKQKNTYRRSRESFCQCNFRRHLKSVRLFEFE